MQTQTILFIILGVIASLLVVWVQYFYKSSLKGRLRILLSILRFISVFGFLFLLINPQFSKKEYQIEKSNLVVLTDNSSSVNKYKESIIGILEKLKSNSAVSERFNIEGYAFGSVVKKTDSLLLNESKTNISKALNTIKDIYPPTNTSVILISDGNQTFGEDYSFSTYNFSTPVFPVVVGDTTRYEDLAISALNVNKFAFLKNKYPVEAYISYQGIGEVNVRVAIKVNGQGVFNKTVKFSNVNNSKVINQLIDANSVGIKNIEVVIDRLEGERNIRNNKKTVTLEVIDEKTKVAIVSDIVHPDIGMLKKTVESNEQRSAKIVKSNIDVGSISDIDLFVLYQPNRKFKSIIEFIEQKKSNTFIIGGTQTDWNFLNNIQQNFQVENGYPVQEVFGTNNPAFSKFDVLDFKVNNFPPLLTNVGPILFSVPNEALLGTKIKGVALENPLLTVYEKEKTAHALFLGEDIWKWRLQAYRDENNFKSFDNYWGKIIRYLTSNSSKDRLNINYKSIFEGSSEAIITATYFDETFVFKNDADIVVQITEKGKTSSKEIPMLIKGAYYKADLTDLAPGDYTFKVVVKKESRSKSGSFKILDYDVEQQFVSSDYKKLKQLADNSKGTMYFPNQIDSLLNKLSTDKRFLPTQKSTENIVSLIDFKIILCLILLTLAIEWFIRKYNGLI